MDKARGNGPLEEDVEVPGNIDFDESDAKDDELTSVIRRSKEEFDFLQKRKGTESSNEASEKSRPTMVSGARVLSIPPIAELRHSGSFKIFMPIQKKSS